MAQPDAVAEFIDASLWHGPLDRAEAIRVAHPDLARSSIYAAAVVGDDVVVREFVAADPALATEKGGPRGWDALTYLCFSKYLQRHANAADNFVRAARALLESGASANTGHFDESHMPEPAWASALYGAAGVAHDAGVTRLLLEHGADPNDNEVPYHSPETRDDRALLALLDSGRVSRDSLTTMLLRKCDWHDLEGIRMLLDRGADPNAFGRWRHNALQHAVLSDNSAAIVELLLDRGGDPTRTTASQPWPPVRGRGNTALAMAAWAGRGDLLEIFAHRGHPIELAGVERLVAAYARADAEAAASIEDDAPELRRELVAAGAEVLVPFARVGNVDGVRLLLDAGMPVDCRLAEDNGYFGVAKDSTALIVASWRAEHDVVKLLIERGADVSAMDRLGRTPLQLAVLACVDSYWVDRRSTESIEGLLRAGATVGGVRYPSGYEAADRLLASHGATAAR